MLRLFNGQRAWQGRLPFIKSTGWQALVARVKSEKVWESKRPKPAATLPCRANLLYITNGIV
jgi:hypothetical protein